MAVKTVQYVSQFDPGAEQLAQNVLKDKQARFDQTYAGLINEYARQGDVFSLDTEFKEKQMNQFKGRVDEVVDKYNGDYGAASKDLARLIAEERQNPFYNLNKLHIQKKAEEMALKNKYGADAIVLNQVPDSLEEVANDPSKLDYEIYDRSKMNQKFLQATEDLVRPRVTDPKRIPGMEGYMAQDYEVTQEDIDNILQDDADISMIMETVPELARIAESQGLDPKQFIQKYGRTMLQDRVGVYKREYLADGTPNVEETSERPSLGGGDTLDALLKVRQNETKKMSDYFKDDSLASKINFERDIEPHLSPFNQTIYRGIKAAKEGWDKFKKEKLGVEEIPNLLQEGTSLTTLKEGIEGIKFLANRRKDKKLKEGEQFVLDFAKKHPEVFDLFNGKSIPLEDIAKAMDDMNEQYNTEFSKTTIPSKDFNANESNFVFVTKQGNVGNVFSRKISAFNPEDGSVNHIVGQNKPDDFYQLIAGKDADDMTTAEKTAALKSVGIEGLNFTGLTPASLNARTIDGTPFEIENTDNPKEIGSTVWGLAEAARKDNESNLLDDMGSKYGITKDDDGLYKIPNYVEPLQRKYGIAYFKVKNELNYNPGSQKYYGKPKIQAYSYNDEPINVEYTDKEGNTYLDSFPLDIIAEQTYYDLVNKGYVEIEE